MAETTTLNAATYTARGTERERVALPGDVFDGTVNVPVMHQVVKAFLANQRQGNASTKTRGKVTGGNQKPWRQKGTGRARQGSTRAPNWVGGGTVFGPQPRGYRQDVPRQVRALARKSALNARAGEGALMVVDRFEYDAPRTSRMVELVRRLGLDGQKVLVLTDGAKPNVFLSARNLPTVHVMPYVDVSTYHVLWSDTVVVEATALGHDLEPVAESEPEPERKERKAPAAAPKKKKAEPAAKKTSARKSAAKKSAAKKSTARKTSARKSAAKKSTSGKGSAKKKTAGKSAAKKTSARGKSAAKKSPARKAAKTSSKKKGK
jgi:large subunit ribosomal protein L4